MKNIPITFNHDHTKVIGHFQFDEDISDEEIVNYSIDWCIDVRDKSLLSAALIPKPAIPADRS